MQVGYQKNEWLCVYADECGDRQIMPFDTFKQAENYAYLIRQQGLPLVGIMTTAFYDAKIEKIIN